MTFQEYKNRYDYEGSVVITAGKRIVPEYDIPKLMGLGKLLASETKHILFRSGNAPGADCWFSEGIAGIDSKRLQAIVPYDSHRKKQNISYDTISLDSISLVADGEVIYHSRQNRKTAGLVDRYAAGERDRYSIKAAYIIRDTLMVTGAEGIPSASCGIFYDDLENCRQGGTGHTMNVCISKGIQVIDQRVWMEWVMQ